MTTSPLVLTGKLASDLTLDAGEEYTVIDLGPVVRGPRHFLQYQDLTWHSEIRSIRYAVPGLQNLPKQRVEIDARGVKWLVDPFTGERRVAMEQPT